MLENYDIENIDIVLGCSFGDEGKGKVVYDLLKKNNYDLCVRFNGSGNAGHTVYENETKFVVHQLPVGILHANTYNLISSDCLIDIERLKNEINGLREKGINIDGRLFISKACHIITQECIDYDKQNNHVGTTGSGIGPTFANKMLRTGKRVEHFENEITELGAKVVNMRKFWKSEFVGLNVKNVLLEGAQGFELDINWTNNYPYCTSSNCTVSGAINTGIPLKSIRNIYGIAKAYDTYVGTLKFQPEQYDTELNMIGDIGKEYGSTTGRRRQCNYMNLDNLIESLSINNCNICIINKTDILTQASVYKLYYDCKLREFSNIDEMIDFIRSKLSLIVSEVIFSFNPYTI
jgi:adenylosuccinate synthase